jgi:hypothetical protein
MKRYFVIALCCLWVVFFFRAFSLFPGSKLAFLAFSFAALGILLSGIFQRISFGYLYLVVFIWLGTWFKLVSRFIFFNDLRFEEGTGMFVGTIDNWNQILSVLIASYIGIFAAFIIYSRVRPDISRAYCTYRAPNWYPKIRTWLWMCAFAIVLIFPLLNNLLGIHQIGLFPRTILPWPSNALISWTLNIGSAMVVSTLLWWDLNSKYAKSLSLFAVAFDAFLSSTSILSRSAYIFRTLPQYYAISQVYKGVFVLNKKTICTLFVVFLLLPSVSLWLVSNSRDYYYSSPAPKTIHSSKSFGPSLFKTLFLSRFIGLEGVMAVQAYPNKSHKLLWGALVEKRKIGHSDLYQKVSRSGYESTSNYFQFGSIPGPAAFFYYSGSLPVVSLGMVSLTSFVLIWEDLVLMLTGNPIICSLLGLFSANTVAQFGITPLQDIPTYFLIFAFCVMLYLLKSIKSCK